LQAVKCGIHLYDYKYELKSALYDMIEMSHDMTGGKNYASSN